MQYAWFIWSLVLLLVWAGVFLSLKSKKSRREMLSVSLATSLLGLTEPIFVPEYWNPPSLFNLAQKTGFDIESFLFSFGVGGLAVVLYEWLLPVKHLNLTHAERTQPRHRFHLWALSAAPLTFLLLFVTTSLNPIYSTIIALIVGGIATWYCRPDLKTKMVVSAGIFLLLYAVYFESLLVLFPDFVPTVWNLAALSRIFIAGIPLEELLFAASLGFLWSSVYEHARWQKISLHSKI